MHATSRLSKLGLALVATLALAGCCATDGDVGTHASWIAERPVAEQRPLYKHRRTAHRVAKPERVNAGARLRQYCGQRHIQYQKGTLRETDAEKMRNNNLCHQVYKA